MDSASRARLSPGTGSTVGARFALDAEAPVEDPPTTGAGATAVPSAPCVLNETAPAGVSQARANKTHDSRRTTRALPLTVSTSRLKGPRQALAFLPFLPSSLKCILLQNRLGDIRVPHGSPSAGGEGEAPLLRPRQKQEVRPCRRGGFRDIRSVSQAGPPDRREPIRGGNGRPEAKGRRSAGRFTQAR